MAILENPDIFSELDKLKSESIDKPYYIDAAE